MESGYSAIAHEQLDAMEMNDPDLYEDVLGVCHEIFDQPGLVRARSGAIRTIQGVRLVTSVPGRFPMKVFWSTDGPRIEAVFPYEMNSR